MRTWMRSKVRLLFMTCAVLLAIPAIALADNAVSDGDGVTPLANQDMAFGNVGCNVASEKDALIAVSRQGTGTNTFANSAKVTVTVQSVTGAGLSAVMDADPSEITLPSDWGSKSNGTLSDNVSSTVTVNSSASGPGSGTVTYAATGKNGSGTTITRTDVMNVSWTTGSCDTTAPSVSSISTANANPTNTTGNLSWNVTFSENVTGVDRSDFQLTNTGLGGSPAILADPDGVTGSGANYTVTASSGTGSGTLGLNLNDNDSIVDGTSNKLGGTGTGSVGSGGTGNGSFDGDDYVIDRTAPTVTPTAHKGPTFTDLYTADTWTNKDVRVTFTCADLGGSGLSPTSANEVDNFTTETSGATATFDGTCADNAGNTAEASNFGPIKIDKSAPTDVGFSGGPAAGGSYDPDSVPNAPTCTANGDISGLASCLVTGYSANVGNHTMTATATDNASNVATAQRSYEVKGWTLKGFYQPVDMTITNTAKAGQTVPLKFEMFEQVSGDERTNPADVKTFSQKVTCGTFTPTEDAIEEYSSGSTSLRYDTTGGQFIFNWQSPKAAGSCFKVTLTPNDTSSNSLVANFKLR